MFKLNNDFVDTFRTKDPNFGFNGLGEITYYRTYSRLKDDGTNENWCDTVERVVNTTYEIQRRHITSQKLKWNELKAQRSAQEMFTRIFEHKFHPPGRGFWAMNLPLIDKVGGAALNNCAFVSTKDMGVSVEEFTKPFEFLMDMSMLGVGVGFDVKGADNQFIIAEPIKLEYERTYVIPDTREGWVMSVQKLIQSYLEGNYIDFDYSLIRAHGEPIKTFGGVASGPEPLIKLHQNIRNTLNRDIGNSITERSIVDIMNMLGVCVVAGNVRRTAEIVFGTSDEFMGLKNYKYNKQTFQPEGPEAARAGWGWASNNSIFAEVGQDYSKVANLTRANGEPGYLWLDNARNYGRMCEAPNYKDAKASGANPCNEQTLESYELCCLVETYPIHHDTLEDYLITLKYAYLYAKTVTLVPTHNEDTNEVLLRNRRIGLSQSGIAMFIDKHGIDKFKTFCMKGYDTIQYYDEVYSNWFKIPRSIKTTSIKPSGTVSLLAGVTPGMHYPESTHYIRRITIAKNSKLIDKLKASNYFMEDREYDPTAYSVQIPVAIEGVRKLDEVSMWEQVALASFLQKYWADNQVSCTITFRPDEGKQIEAALNYFQYELKGISFLPKLEIGVYNQMPYEEITPAEYEVMNSKLTRANFSDLSQDSTMEKYCDGDACII